jgi:hypothetical protein
MGSLSPASTASAESGQHEELVEHGFGYPLQRMVPLESMRLGGEESPILPGLYRIPASQCSSTSSHMFYMYVNSFDDPTDIKRTSTSDFEAVVDEYLSHYQNSDARDMVRPYVTITAGYSCSLLYPIP